MSNSDMGLIFGSVSILHGMHQKLYDEIDQAIEKDPDAPVIAPALKAFIPYLKMYTDYANRFDDGASALTRLNLDGEFSAAINKIKIGKHAGFFGLKNLTITPIQRGKICSFKLFSFLFSFLLFTFFFFFFSSSIQAADCRVVEADLCRPSLPQDGVGGVGSRGGSGASFG
jgi:hypothetical protein